jgi:HemY protein
MRAALWLVALFAVAVAISLFAGNNQAAVTLFWPPYRVDLSLNLSLLLAVGLFVLIHLALRGLAAVFSLPVQARRWRAQQKERAMYAALMDSLSHLVAGRFIRASRAAESALVQEQGLDLLVGELGADSGHAPQRAVQLRALAHLVAAESAHALQNRAVRDQHLQQALQQPVQRQAVELREGIELRAARWALDDRDPVTALARLSQLPQGVARRTLALRLRLRAARLARQTADALDTARLLAKHGAFSAPAAQSILRGLALELLAGAHDPQQLQKAWSLLDVAERDMPEIAVQASTRLLMLGGDAALARQWASPAWEQMVQSATALPDELQSRLVQTLERSMDALDVVWLGRLEDGLQARPRDALLQYVAGMACLKRQLWGKAQQLLSQAVLGLKDAGLQRRAWRALAQLAEERGDAAAAQQAYRRLAES